MCLFSDEELILQFSQKYWEPIMFCLQFGQIQSFIFITNQNINKSIFYYGINSNQRIPNEWYRVLFKDLLLSWIFRRNHLIFENNRKDFKNFKFCLFLPILQFFYFIKEHYSSHSIISECLRNQAKKESCFLLKHWRNGFNLY